MNAFCGKQKSNLIGMMRMLIALCPLSGCLQYKSSFHSILSFNNLNYRKQFAETQERRIAEFCFTVAVTASKPKRLQVEDTAAAVKTVSASSHNYSPAGFSEQGLRILSQQTSPLT